MGMLQAGASGYILKSSSFSELAEGIRAVNAGELFFCKDLRHRIGFKDGRPVIEDCDSALSLLSAKEREVLQLIAEGHTSRGIGEKLGISPRTADVHRAHVKCKLGISNSR